VSAGYCQRSVLGESGMIRTRMGKHSRSVMAAVYGMPCVIQPPNSNNNSNACNLMAKTLTLLQIIITLKIIIVTNIVYVTVCSHDSSKQFKYF
jgi:hypothetical protein